MPAKEVPKELSAVGLPTRPAHLETIRQACRTWRYRADLREAYAALRERGVRFRDEPHLIARLADREVWMTFFHDTEGNTLALMSEVPRT